MKKINGRILKIGLVLGIFLGTYTQGQAQCYITDTGGSDNIVFNSSGGNTTKYFTTGGSCQGSFTYYPSNYSPPSWVNVTLGKNSNGGYVIVRTNSPNTGTIDRTTGFGININGNIIGHVSIKQKRNPQPDPDPDPDPDPQPPCRITGLPSSGQVNFQHVVSNAEVYTLSYPNCSSSSYTFDFVDNMTGQSINSGHWVGLRQLSGNRISIRPVTNSNDIDRMVILKGTARGNSSLIINLRVNQKCREYVYYRDADGDGFGDDSRVIDDCRAQVAGYVRDSGDCDDSDEFVNPDTVWYRDGDNDGYYIETYAGCNRPSGSGWTYQNKLPGDCVDNNAAINPTTVWYGDNDGDGFEASKIQCQQPTGYQLTPTGKPGGDCDDNDSGINPETWWYSNADGDNYRDPSHMRESRQQCTRPSGQWTRSTSNDRCPSLYSNSNNGCPTDVSFTCGGQTFDPKITHDYIDFSTAMVSVPQSGGDASVEVFFWKYPRISLNCSPAIYDITLGGVPSWMSYSISSDRKTIQLNAQPNGGFNREEELTVYINGESKNFFTVFQSGNGPDPGDPDAPVDPNGDDCNLETSYTLNGTPVNDSGLYEIPEQGGSFRVEYDFLLNNCAEDLVIANIEAGYYLDGNGNLVYETPPSWINVGNMAVDGAKRTFVLNVARNQGEAHGGITLAALSATGKTDGSNNVLVYGDPFRLFQNSCVQTYYPDSDGDGKGDVYGVPRTDCLSNLDQATDWVTNNNDLCPNDAAPGYPNGCPNGVAPEARNTVTTRSYDIDQTLKGANKSYFDALGKPEQSQTLDIRTNKIWASETLYDSEGRPALQTLSAPTELTTFEFKDNLTLNSSGNPFERADFESDPDNPDTVSPSEHTTGWYYSENNTDQFYKGNSYQDITDRPYSRTVYSTLNPGSVLKTIGGNKPDTDGDGIVDGDPDDEWPQSHTFTMRASQELSQGPAFGDTAYDNYKVMKTVSRDVHGVENVVFTDTDGKLLAAARSGGTTVRSMSIEIGEQGYVDIHVPQGANMGFTVSSGGTATTTYDLISEGQVSPSTSLPNGFYRVAVNDLDTYDPANPVMVAYKENYYDHSLNEYDETGRLTASYQPLDKLKTEYEYNTLGQLIYTKSPDEGEAWFKYREDGQIRFSQNEEQKNAQEFSYTNYDEQARPVESGVLTEGAITFANADTLLENELIDITIDDDGLDDAHCSEQTFTLYDKEDTASLHTALTASSIPTANYPVQKFVSGNVSKTYTVQPGSGTTTWYSYDIYGRVEWIVQEIEGLGTKTLDYKYHPVTGQVETVDYQKDTPTERFVHKYSYDEIDQLVEVRTSTDGSNYLTHAEYKYYETGGLRRVEYAEGVQGVDYVYNLAGRLKAINDPTLQGIDDQGTPEDDLFGMQLDYHTGDYRRSAGNITSPTYGTDQWNGNIKGVRWKNGAVPGVKYTYGYDRNNWLQNADFEGSGASGSTVEPDVTSTVVIDSGENLTLVASNSVGLLPGFHAKAGSTVTVRIASGSGGTLMDGDYDVSNITYDANGNILTLKRNKATDGTGNTMDDLAYTYKPGTNQLLRVEDAVGDVANADDIGTQTGDNYEYNAIGQLTRNNSEGISYFYNASGLVTEIQKVNKPVLKLYYNDRGHRVKKESFLADGITIGKTTHYVRDVSGQVMAIYVNDVLAEQPIYGSSRLGVAFNGTNNEKGYVYELTDHLGNVRATFSRTGATEGASDYYPFGMPMPGRNVVGDYRYAFQGQEKDPETGKEAFQLRLWDSRIGRWLSPDPYGEFSSPYIGMGNNPNVFIDVDGGRIIVAYGGNNYEYRNGQLFDGSGNVYTGNDNFLIETRNALSTLDYVSSTLELQADGSITKNGIINSIVESDDIYRIVYQRRKHHTNGATTRIDNKATVSTPTEDGIIASPYAITLGHELGHQFSLHNNIKNTNEWFNLEGKPISFDENFASNFENVFRDLLNLPSRTHYGILDGNPIGEIFTPYGLFFNQRVPTQTRGFVEVGRGTFGAPILD